MTHGVNTQTSKTAGEMVNPPLKPLFKQRAVDKLEGSLYKSLQKAPLGKSHDQSVGFPKAYPWKDLTYGVVTFKGKRSIHLLLVLMVIWFQFPHCDTFIDLVCMCSSSLQTGMQENW